MKTRQPLLALIFVCFAATTIQADEIVPEDGRIIVGHGSDPAPPTCHPTSLSFSIQTNRHGGGIANCVNETGQDWIGLDIFAKIPLQDSVNCIKKSSGTNDAKNAAFDSCHTLVLSTLGNTKNVEILFSSGEIFSGTKFFFNLNTLVSSNMDDPGGWGAFATLDVQAVPAPEPGSLLLLASGLSVLYSRRRRPL